MNHNFQMMPTPPNHDEVVQELYELRECYDLMLKTARRCTRDLDHAIDQIDDLDSAAMFRSRQKNYATIFASTTDYHIQLHREIENRDHEIARLEAYVKDIDRQWAESIASRDAEITQLKAEVARLNEPRHQYTRDDMV